MRFQRSSFIGPLCVFAALVVVSLTACTSSPESDEPVVAPTPIQDVRIEGLRAS
jgi:hypothetical protein